MVTLRYGLLTMSIMIQMAMTLDLTFDQLARRGANVSTTIGLSWSAAFRPKASMRMCRP